MFSLLKQRRLQFTVANALLVTTIAAISMGWWLDHRRLTDQVRDNADQHQSLSALVRLGTDITFDADGNPTKVDFYPTRCADQDVAHLRYLPTVREVHLQYCYNISDKAIEHLTHLPNLEVLYLYRNNPSSHNNCTMGVDLTKQSRITDKSLETIATIRSLKELYLWDNDFSDDGILKLRSLRNLENLSFRSPKISDAAVATLNDSLPNINIE